MRRNRGNLLNRTARGSGNAYPLLSIQFKRAAPRHKRWRVLDTLSRVEPHVGVASPTNGVTGGQKRDQDPALQRRKRFVSSEV